MRLNAASLLVLSVVGEAMVFLALLDSSPPALSGYRWLLLHVLASVAAAFAVTSLITLVAPEPDASYRILPLSLLVLLTSLCMPLAGVLGLSTALLYSAHQSARRHQGADSWQMTSLSDLPYTIPTGRANGVADTRGLSEQLTHGVNDAELYRKVLAAGNMRPSLSIGTLKRAIEHPDERIRLTAYQSLDQQVTTLNREIQRLEALAASTTEMISANTWLQIADNYRELLTLEQDEPIARAQLLDKINRAASKAADIEPENRNAYFMLGQVHLMQGDAAAATVALERSQACGMPATRVLPYLAEAAFERREYNRVASLLHAIEPASLRYPPLSHVANYWK